MSLSLTLFPIRTEADYRAALARAEAFFDAPKSLTRTVRKEPISRSSSH